MYCVNVEWEYSTGRCCAQWTRKSSLLLSQGGGGGPQPVSSGRVIVIILLVNINCVSFTFDPVKGAMHCELFIREAVQVYNIIITALDVYLRTGVYSIPGIYFCYDAVLIK